MTRPRATVEQRSAAVRAIERESRAPKLTRGSVLLGFAFGWALAIVASARPAHAQSAAWATGRAVRLEILGGTNTPSGNWSLGLAADVIERLSLALAVGEDLSGQHLRIAFAPRVRIIAGAVGPATFAIDAAAPLSYADGEEMGESFGDVAMTTAIFERRWDPLYRAGPELGLTLLPSSRLSLRVFTGVAFPLNGSTCFYWTSANHNETDCRSSAIPEDLRRRYRFFPYVGASLSVGVLPLGAPTSAWATLAQRGEWYGWQLLVVDAATLGLLLAVADRDTNVHYWIGDNAGAAILHALHDRPWRALASVSLRVGLTIAGMITGMWLTGEDPHVEGDPFAGALPGALAGWLSAMLIDDLLLARD